MRANSRRFNLYAMYDGEEFLDVGTYPELIKKYNLSKGAFFARVSRSMQGKYKKKVIMLVGKLDKKGRVLDV